MNAHQRREALNAIRRCGIAVPPDVTAYLDQAIPGPTIRTWSWWAAVWSRPRAADWAFSESELTAAQAAWDRSKRFVDAQNALRADVDTRKAAEMERAQAARAKEDAARRDALLAKAKRAFLAAGGSESDWERERDAVAADIAKQTAIAAGVNHQRPDKPVLPAHLYR